MTTLAAIKAWWTALQLLWKYGPQILSLVREICELFSKHREQLAKHGVSTDRLEDIASQQHETLAAAVTRHVVTGDTAPLVKLRDKQREICGMECRQMGTRR